MRENLEIVHASGVDIAVVTCGSHEKGWSAEEPTSSLCLVLPSEGMFMRRVDGVEHVVDSVRAYVQLPGQTQQIAHPAGGDVCTAIMPSEPIIGALGDPSRLHRAALIVSPAVDLAHRILLARARDRADDFELSERAATLVGGILDTDPLVYSGRASRLDRRLATRVREAIDGESPATLVELARLTGVSAYRLSRSFRRVTGLTVTGYRSQLRTRQALARLSQGDRNLAGIAADVGFADQAHLTRTLRAYSGRTPGALRAVLSPSS
jgi:AraC-like DNA-binding protein